MTPHRPVVVQHSFGDPGSGGPIGSLQRVLDSSLASRYRFVRMHQGKAAGSIDYQLLRAWVSMLRDIRPDLVHVRGLGNEGFHGALAARLAHVPAVLVSIHGTVRDLTTPMTLKRRVLVSGLEPSTLTMATDIVTVCRATAERSFLDPWRSKVRGVVPNGVDPLGPYDAHTRTTARDSLGLADSRVVLAVVGRLSLEKGHAILAAAMRHLAPTIRSRVVLLLVGDGPDSERIVEGYRAVPLLDTRVLGRRHDVTDLLRASDAFVFPTFHENLSNALLEAMACGLPVVATSVGGNVEVLERGGGLLVPAMDITALADGVSQLVTDEALRSRLGREALTVITQSYTVDHMVSSWDTVYAEAVARSGS